MYSKIKSSVGRINPLNRFADTSDTATPDDEIDVEAWSSTATIGLGERIKRSGRTIATFGLLSVAILGILFAWARNLAVDIITNPLLQGLAVVGAIILVSFVYGAKHQRKIVTDTDQLVLQMPEGTTRFFGTYETAGDGTKVFLPYRGFDWLGFKKRPLTLRELGESITRTFAKRQRNPDDPVRVRVDDAVVQSESTAQGEVVSVNTDGLEIDQFGQYSDVYATPPSQVSEQNYRQLHRKLEIYTEQIVPKYKEKLVGLRQENDDLRERITRTDEEAVDTFIERLATASVAMDASRNRSRNQDSNAQSNGDGSGVGEFDLEELMDQ